MATDQIRQILRDCGAGNRRPVTAVTFRQKFPSASRPILVRCDDDGDYVLKGSHNGRSLVADHVVGRLGQLLGAPVGQVGFGVIPAELKAIEPQLSDVGTGLCHATRWVPNCSDKQGLDHVDKLYNRERFVLLRLLYSWTIANDHQLIYAKSEPFLVYSVDHGHFLNGSTGWTPASLREIGPVTLDPYFSGCGLPDSAFAGVKTQLAQVTNDDLRMIAAGPPDEWGVTHDDRIAITEYLVARRDRLLTLLP